MLELSRGQKLLWWVGLIVILTVLLIVRQGEILGDGTTGFDALVFVLWLALLLSPLFSDVSIFGIRLRHEIKELKADVRREFAEIRTEVRASSDSRAYSQVILTPYGPLPSDAAIPEIERKIDQSVRAALQSYGVEEVPAEQSIKEIPAHADTLFRVRFNLERELRKIWLRRLGGDRYAVPLGKILNALISSELLPPNLVYAIREVYQVTSAGVHGEDVSPAKVAFVERTAPELIAALRAIAGEEEEEEEEGPGS